MTNCSIRRKQIFILEISKTINMKKGILYTLLTAIIVCMVGCDGMDATYTDFIKDGPIVYIGKADSLKAFSGKNRIKLTISIGKTGLSLLRLIWIVHRRN